MLRFRALGRPLVEGPDGPIGAAGGQRMPVALLGLLAASGERGMSRDKILAYLWPETAEDRATHRLTQILYSLRRDLGADDLFLGSADLRLNPLAISSDIADFHAALAGNSPERAVPFYGGPFLDGFFLNGGGEFDRWVEEERAGLSGQFTAAMEQLAEGSTRNGDHVLAAHWWGRLAQLDPLNARVAVRYMEALARAGDRAGALRVSRSHESRLRQEFDAAPDPAVQALAGRIRAQAAEEPSVAVLPFVNISPERENEYFSDGMTEELTNALANVPGLRVASRTSAFAFKAKDLDVAEIGARLGVKNIVEGSVRKVGNRIRITAQLVDTASGYHVWSQTYDRTLADVFALQEEISQAIVRALPLRPGVKGPSLVRSRTPVLEAYTLYLRGRYFALQRTCPSFRVAVEYFEQAIELDPEYAPAHAGIGECYTLRGFEEFGDLPPREAMPRGQTALEHALSLDSELAEGHTWRAVIAFLFERDWGSAESGFKHAIELKPTYSLAHTWYAIFLSARGRHEEALARIHHAERLEPLALTVQTVVPLCYYFARRFDEALHRYLSTLEMHPENLRMHARIARIHLATGRSEAGLKTLEAAMDQVGRPPILLVQQALFLAALGRRKEADQVIAELQELRGQQYVSLLYLAPVHRSLGQEAMMLKRYEEALDDRSGYLSFLEAEPMWDPLREDRHFLALLEKVGSRLPVAPSQGVRVPSLVST